MLAKNLEKYFIGNLGAKLHIANTHYDNKLVEFFSDREKNYYSNLDNHLKKDWVSSRRSLFLVNKIGPLDLTKINFPHKNLSLTHHNGESWALSCYTKDILGVGIDFEKNRYPKIESYRFFLTKIEQSWLKKTRKLNRQNLLKLWTIKEALFKSDPHNHDSGIRDYQLSSLDFNVGTARKLNDKSTLFYYSNYYSEKLSLSVALSKRG